MRSVTAPCWNYTRNAVTPARTSRSAAGERTLSAPLAFVVVGEGVEPGLEETMFVAAPVTAPVVVVAGVEGEEVVPEAASNKSVDWKV